MSSFDLAFVCSVSVKSSFLLYHDEMLILIFWVDLFRVGSLFLFYSLC